MRFSSSFKVGLLTLTALIILLFSILWIKGRALSAGERLFVDFKDINGMRPGSAVQLMGLRIGQVEDITPVLTNPDDPYVRVKFVITEPDITIPNASTISIQQSGIIGEQFLEITPPKLRTVYLPINRRSQVLHANDKVQMILSNQPHEVGKVKKIEIIQTKTLPINIQEEIKTPSAYKVGYIITLPGLQLPDRLQAKVQTADSKHYLFLKPYTKMELAYPQSTSRFTVIEPLRLSDFMELQYRAAMALAETNEKLSALMSDDIIADLKNIVGNIDMLTIKANSTLDKTQALLDSSKKDLDALMVTTDKLSEKIIVLTDNINNIIGDEEFKDTLMSTTKSIDRLSQNLNKVLEDPKTKETMDNLNAASKNISEIAQYVNTMTKDPVLKEQINTTVTKFNKALDDLSCTLETVNSLTTDKKEELNDTINNVNETSKNLRKFSEKLNKRFLLFRLMF